VVGNFSEVLLSNADKVIAACKSLDYQGIIEHKPAEVEKLKSVLRNLSICARRAGESLDDYARRQERQRTDTRSQAKDERVVESKKDIQARQQRIIEHLNHEGFNERIGKVYNSFSKSRSSAFNQVPHRRGLPPFDIVLAPDFAPVAGLHGIFITADEVMSVILASEGQSNSDWEIMKRKPYHSSTEMVELVTLVAAGFDLM
jgi:hypothetical protein